MDGLTEGRIVHYVLSEGRYKGQHRPAIVVRVWRLNTAEGGQVPPPNGCCQLQVFTDSENDNLPSVVWKTSVVNDEACTPGSWHWIEKA